MKFISGRVPALFRAPRRQQRLRKPKSRPGDFWRQLAMNDVLVNGSAAAGVPADDRGLLYGDGLFESIAFVGDRAPLWDVHMARLSRSAAALGFEAPDSALLADDCRQLVDGRNRSVVRIVVTRGSGGRAYTPLQTPRLRRIVQRRSWPAGLGKDREAGLDFHTSPIRLAAGGALAGLKHGCRLEQVLAAQRADQAGVDDALLYDANGWLTESVSSNVVLFIDGQAGTPVLDDDGVAGVGLTGVRGQRGEESEDRRIARRWGVRGGTRWGGWLSVPAWLAWA